MQSDALSKEQAEAEHSRFCFLTGWQGPQRCITMCLWQGLLSLALHWHLGIKNFAVGRGLCRWLVSNPVSSYWMPASPPSVTVQQLSVQTLPSFWGTVLSSVVILGEVGDCKACSPERGKFCLLVLWFDTCYYFSLASSAFLNVESAQYINMKVLS